MTGLVQGLLSSIQPWVTGGSSGALSDQYGGMPSLMTALLQAGGPDTTYSRMGAALDRERELALGDAAQRQQLATGNVNLQRQAMMLPYLNAYYRAAMGGQQSPQASPGAGADPPNGAPQATASASAPVVGAFSARPQTATASAAPDTSPFAIPTPDQIASLPVGGMSPAILRLGGILNGQNPLDTAAKIRQQQIALAQQKYGPALAQLDTLDKAQSPAQYVSANPALQAEWQQLAPSLGMDPVKGFTDANVRTAFSFLRNRIAGSLGEPTVAPPVQMSTFRGPLNSLYTKSPVTGDIKQVRGEEGLKPVVGKDGTVTYVPASQAAGQQAFSDETYVNPTTTAGMARMIANYEIPPLSGFALRSAQGQAIMAAVKQLNPQYDSTQFTTKQKARQAFATGKQGDIVRSLSVATSHLDQLSQAADALAQHDFPTFNRIVNAIGKHVTGASPQTDFDAMKEIVGDEVVKAVVGSGGAEGDRQAIKDAFDAARSPEQIQGVIQKYEGLMGGQLAGLKRQYKRATGLNDFDSFVSQQAEHRLNSAGGGALSDAALLNKWGGR